MKLRKYMVYLDDGRSVIKIAVPASSVVKARKYVSGNGEIVALKDVTEDYPISVDKVFEALNQAHFCRDEIDFIIRTLTECDIVS